MFFITFFIEQICIKKFIIIKTDHNQKLNIMYKNKILFLFQKKFL